MYSSHRLLEHIANFTLYGDEVLVLLAQIMKNCFREDDMLFRFGGEEFVVILRSPSKEGCAVALERLRKRIEDTEFPGVGKVTISVGAVKMEHGVFHITLPDYADQSLYYSKNNGRNRVTFFDDLVAKGEEPMSKRIMPAMWICSEAHCARWCPGWAEPALCRTTY